MPDLDRGRLRVRLLALLLLGGIVGGAYYVLRPKNVATSPFESEPVARRTVVKIVAVNGHLDAKRRIEVPAPGTGTLTSIDVEAGDRVVAGQILAHLDEPRVDIAMGSAQAAVSAATSRLASARVALAAAETEHVRLHNLVGRGLASEADLAASQVRIEQARAALDVARADQSAASSNLAGARLGRDFGVVRAPTDGVVLDAPRNTGSLLAPGQPLFVLGSGLDVLRVDASVGEADVGEMHTGQSATFEVPAFLGRTFTATVVHVAPDADVAQGATTFPIRLEAPNADGALRSGMTAMLRIEVARAENVLSVREAALRFTPEGAPPAAPRSRVWKHVGGNRLEPVAVTAGVSDGAYTEVRPAAGASLREGDEIVLGMRMTAEGRGAGVTLGGGGPRATTR